MSDLSALLGKPASPLGFGVMQFGGKADAQQSRALYDRCRAAGITLFDAAWVYTEGKAETLLGEFAEAERDEVILISKCGYEPGQSGDDLKAQVAESLRRLRTDHVDILYLHRHPTQEKLDEQLLALKDLHADGAFRLLGVSNFAAWEVMQAQARAAALGAPPVSVLQPMYNLVKRQAEVEILPMARTTGLVVHSYSPLGGGLLTGKYAGGQTGRLSHDERYAVRYGPRWMHDAAAELREIAHELGVGPAALAIAWVARNPAISAPLISASHPDQLPASLEALEVRMTDDLYARLSALTPAPPPATDRLEEA